MVIRFFYRFLFIGIFSRAFCDFCLTQPLNNKNNVISKKKTVTVVLHVKAVFQVKQPKDRRPKTSYVSKSPQISRSEISVCNYCKHPFEAPELPNNNTRKRTPSGSILSIAMPKRRVNQNICSRCEVKPITGYIEKVFSLFFSFCKTFS